MVQHFVVKDDRIYILTYHEKDGLNEILVLDLKGNLKRRVEVKLKKFDQSIFNIYPFDIKNNRLFQLAENPDTEEYELHISELK